MDQNNRLALFAAKGGNSLGLGKAVSIARIRARGVGRVRQFADAHLLKRLCVLLAGLGFLCASSCATPHATLLFNAPSAAVVNAPFSITVNVIYHGKPDTVINSNIHFTSSDPSAILPGDYYFTPADAGSHTWTNGFVLRSPGIQTISGSILDASGVTPISGSTNITVSP